VSTFQDTFIIISITYIISLTMLYHTILTLNMNTIMVDPANVWLIHIQCFADVWLPLVAESGLSD
jgi:hypothetical protein